MKRCCLCGLVVAAWCVSIACGQETHQATGVKVGEVTPDSAIVWMRLTAGSKRKADGVVVKGRAAETLPAGTSVDDLEGACPGMAGRVRLRYGAGRETDSENTTAWGQVGPDSDFTHQFRLTGLKPATEYVYFAETGGSAGTPAHAPLRGRFETAPRPDQYADATFTAITGQMYNDLDDPDGFHIYEAMAALKPKFIVPTGDTVYYDNESPRATTVAAARHHWHRMYSLPRLVAFHLQVPGYWEKDDHDTIFNDCWPTMMPPSMLPMTFEQGQRIFREQVPMGEKTYRTVRWGKSLEVWLVEGRDFRSPNNAPDGPDKSIWGREQKQWLMRTLLASDAEWKVLVSPTPIVGPDRGNKADNHANRAFKSEGDEMRRWFQKNLPENFFLVCGDRHWQYHSVDPETGVREFSCGPASDQHASGSPGEDPTYHRFHRVKGGFLSVSVSRPGEASTIVFRLHDVHGKIVCEYRKERESRTR